MPLRGAHVAETPVTLGTLGALSDPPVGTCRGHLHFSYPPNAALENADSPRLIREVPASPDAPGVRFCEACQQDGDCSLRARECGCCSRDLGGFWGPGLWMRLGRK